MEQGKKHILIAVGVAFVCGAALTLAAVSLCSCPAKRGRLERPRPAVGRMIDGPRDGIRPDRRRGPDFRHEKDGRMAPRPDGDFDRALKPGADGQFDRHRRHPNPEMKERFAAKLKLTEEQKAQIEAFRKEDMAKIEPLFAKMDELRKEADKLRDENKARFESILTPEQKEILADMHKKRMERMDRPRHHENAPRPAFDSPVPEGLADIDDKSAREIPAGDVLSKDEADAAKDAGQK